MSHCNILEMKLGSDKIMELGIVCVNKGTIVIKQMGYVRHN